MAQIDVRREYADGDILLASDLDAFLDDVETFLNTTKINDDNIQTSGITASTKLVDASISTAKLANLAVTTAKLEDLNVTTGKIADSAVTTAKINAGAVTEAKLDAGSVTTLKIGNAAVTTAKLDDGAVTQAKRAALGHQVSSSCSTYSNATGSFTQITNFSISITTTGRPVMIMVIPDGSGSPGFFYSKTTNIGNDVLNNAQVRIRRDSTAIGYHEFMTEGINNSAQLQVQYPLGSVTMVDVPAAGTYTYDMAMLYSGTSTGEGGCYYGKLFVYEL